MLVANYRHIGGGENRLGRHYSRFSAFSPTTFLAAQSLALRKFQNGGSNRRRRAKGGQFVLHAKALHGNPFDGHTLGPVVAELEALTGVETRRIHVDKGYRGHNHAQKFRVWISGQVRRVTAPIRREMRRRAAVEPVIGHMKAEHRMGRNYLKGRDGDRCNAVLAAAGYNFSLLLRWLEWLLRALMRMLLTTTAPAQNANERSSSVLHGRLYRRLYRGLRDQDADRSR